MHRFHFRVRAVLRRKLNDPSITSEQAAQIEAVLSARGGVDLLAEEAGEKYDQLAGGTVTDQLAGGTVTDFFQWLLDHSDQLFALLAKVLLLLGL